MANRVPSGIAGLDDKIGGGFVAGSVNLIAGKTGTGKTAFVSSFLYEGAKRGEPGFYLTTEEREEDIRGDITATFGWDLGALEQKRLLKIVSLKPFIPSKQVSQDQMNAFIRLYTNDLFSKVEDGIKAVKAKRVVIDSISIIELFIKDPYLARAVVLQLVDRLKERGVTTLFTGTVPESSGGLSGADIVEYLVDSIIKLDYLPTGEKYKRFLTIRKMRRTDHSAKVHPIAFGKGGMKLVEI